MNVYLNHFVTPCNTRVSAALDETAFVILRCSTDQLQSIVSVCCSAPVALAAVGLVY